ncbi:MAG: hypothetical protein ACKVQJ_01450 [Pyrinomonadaceae bacterium]
MTESVLNVRSKPIGPTGRSRSRLGITILAAVLTALGLTIAFDAYSGRIGIIAPRFEIIQNGATKIIRVPPGGNLQAAIAKAESGDIVELQAGAVYYGPIKLPNKPLTEYVTIQSSSAAMLPVDQRVSPAQRSLMATILARNSEEPAVSAANGAHHYRFVGIEFAPKNGEYLYNLVLFGNDEPIANVPHDLEIDRSYLHPFKTGTTRRGIALNSSATTIKNSYIEGFAFPQEETQAICGWSGTRNVHIINNYVEAGAENIMFGGSDPASADLIPSDIEIRGNHLHKPAEWNGKATLKTLFELKNAKRVQLIGNFLESNWGGAAIRVTVRNQDGNAPFSTIEDVTIRDNIINGSGDGINILGKDDTNPSQTLKRLNIVNNLFLNIGEGNGYSGSGYFIQIADGEQIAVENNTVLNRGNAATFYGVMPRSIAFRNNFIGYGSYGVYGLADQRSAESRAIFQNNYFLNLNRISPAESFPPGNSLVRGLADVGFVNPGGGDYRLAETSKFRVRAGSGKNIGSDISAAEFIRR